MRLYASAIPHTEEEVMEAQRLILAKYHELNRDLDAVRQQSRLHKAPGPAALAHATKQHELASQLVSVAEGPRPALARPGAGP